MLTLSQTILRTRLPQIPLHQQSPRVEPLPRLRLLHRHRRTTQILSPLLRSLNVRLRNTVVFRRPQPRAERWVLHDLSEPQDSLH